MCLCHKLAQGTLSATFYPDEPRAVSPAGPAHSLEGRWVLFLVQKLDALGSPFVYIAGQGSCRNIPCVEISALKDPEAKLQLFRWLGTSGQSLPFLVCEVKADSSSHIGNVLRCSRSSPPLTCFLTGSRSWTEWPTAWCSVPFFPVRNAQASWSSRAMPTTVLGTSLPGPSAWSRHRRLTGRSG